MTRVEVRIKDQDLVERRQSEIVEAARHVFREKGFHGATVREIGRAANMTQGTLYNYARSKEDVLFLVCDQMTRGYQEAVKRAWEAPAGVEERLQAAVEALVETIQSRQDDLLLLYQEVDALTPAARHKILDAVRNDVDFFVRILREAQKAGVVAIDDERLAGNLITFIPAVIPLRRWNLRGKQATEIRNGVVKFILRGLGVAVDRKSGKQKRSRGKNA